MAIFNNKEEVEGFAECYQMNPQATHDGLVEYLKAKHAQEQTFPMDKPCPVCGGEVRVSADDIVRCTQCGLYPNDHWAAGRPVYPGFGY